MAYPAAAKPSWRCPADVERSLARLLPQRSTLRTGDEVTLQRLVVAGSVTDNCPPTNHSNNHCNQNNRTPPPDASAGTIVIARRDVIPPPPAPSSSTTTTAATTPPSRTVPAAAAISIIHAIFRLLNDEITAAGNSYPFEHAMSFDQFLDYYFAYDVFVLLRYPALPVRRRRATEAPRPSSTTAGLIQEDEGKSEEENQEPRQEEPSSAPALVGCFYIKPNWPGRCSHICNGGFLVDGPFRGSGAGFVMAEAYRLLAQALGYKGSVFNLVFETNDASNALWRRLGFINTGRIPAAGRLKTHGRRDATTMDRFVAPLSSPHNNSFSQKTNNTSSKEPHEGTNANEQEQKGDDEAYVAALQWYLDLRPPLPRIPTPWSASRRANTCRSIRNRPRQEGFESKL